MKKETKFKKGISGNPNGRPKGTLNKTTMETKEAIKTIIDAEFEQLDTYLEQLTAKERLDFLTKLLPYVVPKQSEVSLDTEKEVIISFEDPIDYSKLSTATLMEIENAGFRNK